MSQHKKVSIQSKSFAILFAIAIIGTYLCLLYSEKITGNAGQYDNFFFPGKTPDYEIMTYKEVRDVNSVDTKSKSVDTSTWKTFSNTKYGFTIQYPSSWQIKSLGVQGDYYVIQINPTKTDQPMTMHINHKNFLALEGLPTTKETLNGDPLLDIKDELYGLQHQGIYMTFDVGPNLKLKDEFKAFVRSIKFQ